MSKFRFKLDASSLPNMSRISVAQTSKVKRLFNDGPPKIGADTNKFTPFLLNGGQIDDENYMVQEQKGIANLPQIITKSHLFNLPYHNPPHKPFGMQNMQEALRYFKAVYQLGTSLKVGYVVTLKPYNNQTVALPIFAELQNIFGFLAVDVEMPILGATFEQKRFGAFNFNRLAEYSYPSFTITFLETKYQHIIRSLMQYRKLMLSDDGTVKLPAEYALSLSVRVYGNGEMMKDGVVIDKFVVAINTDSIQGLNAKDYTPLEIPVTFNVLSHYA